MERDASRGDRRMAGGADATRLEGSELLELLNALIEAERAGARGVEGMSREAANPTVRVALHDVATDEARFCAMLMRHVTRLGGVPSPATGAFLGKLRALERVDERLEFLNRGQGWVVRRLTTALPRIADPALRGDLREMLDVHAYNIKRCTALGLRLAT